MPRAPSPESDDDQSLMPELDDIVVMGIPLADWPNENEVAHAAAGPFKALVQNPLHRQRWPEVLPLAARVANSTVNHGATLQYFSERRRLFFMVHNDTVGHCTAAEAAVRLAHANRAWRPHEDMCVFLADMTAACKCNRRRRAAKPQT